MRAGSTKIKWFQVTFGTAHSPIGMLDRNMASLRGGGFSAPPAAFRQRDSTLGIPPALLRKDETSTSKRPFTRPQRVYPYRHPHGGVNVPGLLLRCYASHCPRPLTARSFLDPLADRGSRREPPVSLALTSARHGAPASRSPSGTFAPSGSVRSGRIAAGSLPLRNARSPFAPQFRPAL